MEHLIKYIRIHNQKIELHMHTARNIHEYQLLLIQKADRCLKLERTIENKALLVCDISGFCSLSKYLKDVPLQEQQFVLLLINLFESIVALKVDKVLYLDIHYIFIENETREFKFLCIPVLKDNYEVKDTHIRLLICELLKQVQVDDAYALFGMLVQELKNRTIQLPLLLQQLHQEVEIRKKRTFFEKYILKKEEPEVVLPSPIYVIHNRRKERIESNLKQVSDTSIVKSKEKAYLYDGEQYINLSCSHMIIGRSQTCDFILEDQAVSKRHICIIWRDYKYYVKDLCSKNGTWLNSIKLEPENIYHILHKDILYFASYSFTFYYE